MKSAFILTIFLLSLFCGNLYAEPVQIKLGYFTAAPHLYQPEGQNPQGALIDFFDQQIIQGSNYEATWYGPYSHARLAKLLESGELDGMALLRKTKEKAQYLYYPNAPFFEPNSILMFLKDHPITEIKSADDLAGQRIGLLRGIKGTPFLITNADKLTIDSISGKDSVKRNLIRLKEKRIDAIFCPEIPHIRYETSQMGISDQVKILPIPEPPIQLNFAFSKKSANGLHLLELYNDRTVDFKGTQEKYLKLLEKYF